jgi:hypothetical protein
MENLPMISRSGRTAELMDFEFQEQLFQKCNTCLSIRKLREALVSSQREDLFTIKVYEKSIDIAVKEENMSELFRTVTRLVELYLKFEMAGEAFGFHVLLLTANNCPMMELIPLIRRYPKQEIKRAIEWYQARKQGNYIQLAQLRKSSCRIERFILANSMQDTRAKIHSILQKGYRSLPSSVCKEYLLLDEVQDLHKMVKVDPDGSVYFRPKKTSAVAF